MPRPIVLVVDDTPINVELLKRILMKDGIDVITAESGADALNIVSLTPPDLILLDMMMPDISGIEVCQRLQANDSTRHIPVIFVTAQSSHETRLEGLEVGAVDYITKPIDLKETRARVQTQLRLVAINREMMEIQHRLDEARRTATIGAMTQGLAHNLNNLLGVALGYIDLIHSHSDQPERVKKNAQQAEIAVQRIIDLIRLLGTLVSKSRPPLVRCALGELLRMATTRFHAAYTPAPAVVIENALGDILIETHREMFEETLIKLLVNAWEAYGDKPAADRTIWIRTTLKDKLDGRTIEITIEDAGLGISETVIDTLYEPFVSTKATVGAGMGLTVARHAMRTLGGSLNLSSRVGGGTVAAITHPVESKRNRTPATRTS